MTVPGSGTDARAEVIAFTRVPGLGERAAGLRQEMVDERLRHRAYTRAHGDDAKFSYLGVPTVDILARRL
jgi:hypothetical protein